MTNFGILIGDGKWKTHIMTLDNDIRYIQMSQLCNSLYLWDYFNSQQSEIREKVNDGKTSHPSWSLFPRLQIHFLQSLDGMITGWARLNRSLSSARFYFELSGNSNYIIHCKSNYVQNFELEINSIWNFDLGFTSNYCFELWLPSS